MIVVMGVAGSGKTSVGEELARRLGWPFVEGDAFHPEANRRKMAGGTPLTDEDRWPWLDAVAAEMRRLDEAGVSAVVACSALKRSYRARLEAGAREVAFVHLHGSREVLATRIRARKGHFMPPELLDSQVATLEPPGAGENAVTVDVAPPVAKIVDEIVRRLGLAEGAADAARR
jgi:carbohydrate kinase (thermoresistant glucokinase family)